MGQVVNFILFQEGESSPTKKVKYAETTILFTSFIKPPDHTLQFIIGSILLYAKNLRIFPTTCDGSKLGLHGVSGQVWQGTPLSEVTKVPTLSTVTSAVA